MGIFTWLAAGLLATLLGWMLPPRIPERRAVELASGLLAAMVLGAIATALDFGGWREPDWRAALFAGFGTLALLGTLRAVRLARQGR